MNTRRYALAVSTALLSAVALPSRAQVDNQPDGDYSEWDLTQDLYAAMYEAGDSAKAHLSDFYFRYDPDTGVAHVLVLTTPGNTASVTADNAWVKVYDIAEDTQVDGTSADFAWIYDGDTPVGYEAAFPLPLPAGGNDTYDLVEVHVNVGGATSSTGKHNAGIETAAISLALSDGIRDDIVVNPDGGSSSGDDTGGSSSGGDTGGSSSGDDTDSSSSGGDTGGSSGGETLTGDPDDGAGDGTGGLLSFENCDSRSGEIGRRISIGRSGVVTTRYVQCD